MSLQSIGHIEGLDREVYEQVALANDTNPAATIIEFFVKVEDMPGLSQQAGRLIQQPFVWIKKTMELGRNVLLRRVVDHVELDPETKKWKVRRLAEGHTGEYPVSDILRYQEEWNAFMRGTSYEEIGSPLTLLFASDPSRVEMYRSFHVTTVEQLSKLGETSIQTIGMGCRADVERAKAFLAKASENTGAVATARMQKVEEENASLRATIDDLTDKLNQLLAAQIESLESGGLPVRRGRGRPRKTDISNIQEGAL